MTKPTMQPNEISEVLNRPISQELLARDVTRLGCSTTSPTTPTSTPTGTPTTATVLLDGIADFNDPSIGRDDAPDDGNASGLRAVGPSCGSLDNRRTDVETGATAPSYK